MTAALARLALFCSLALASVARAHPQAAEGPSFAPGACVEVVDKSVTPSLHIAYDLPFDDDTLGAADLRLPDSRTHQFLAFAGGVHPAGLFYALFPTDAARPSVVIPDWLAQGDVDRAVQASPNMQGIAFAASDVGPEGVLEQLGGLSSAAFPISSATQRVPITMAQARKGVDWDLRAIEPGVYSVAGYVFSPPYNGWSIRNGLVKVRAPGHDMGAAVLDPINVLLFPYQGRRVRACIDAPSGTRLRGYVRVEDRVDHEWMAWLPEREVASGMLELCFHSPSPELSGLLRVRLELQTPDGAVASYYSPDMLTSLQGQGRCVTSDTVCCDFAGAGGQAAPAANTGGQPGTAITAGTAAAAGAAAQPAGGCSVTRAHPGSDFGALCGALLLAAGLRTRSQSRRRAL